MATETAPVEALASAQRVALQALQAVGLAPDAHGQPGWPFAHRLAVETLAIDPSLGRRALIALACAVAATLLLAAGAASPAAAGRRGARRRCCSFSHRGPRRACC